MNTELLSQYAPKAIFAVAALGLVYILREYKRKNDVSAWLREVYAKTAKASQDEEYRQAELADAEEKIARYPVPNPVIPITNAQQVRIAGFPKLVFLAGLCGVFTLYFGLFNATPQAVNWPLYVGGGLLALALAMYVVSEKTRSYYGRVQQINRKYLLQKVGKDAARFASLRQVLEYYPKLAELWMELADQYAVDGNMNEATEAIAKARELAPDNVDVAVVEASFQLRNGNTDAALKILDEAENLKKAETDPRCDIYRAAAALRNNEKRKAEKHCEKALELDRSFTEKLMEKDDTLGELLAFAQPLLQRENGENSGEDEAARSDVVASPADAETEGETEGDVEQALEKGEGEG